VREEEIIELIINRDEEGMDALLKYYSPLMRYVITPVLGDIGDVEDCLYESAMKVWEKIELFDINKGSIAKITDDIKSKYVHVDKHVFDTSMNEKLKEPEGSSLITEYMVCRHDIDTNHHVNNLNYLDFAYEAIPEDVFFNTDFKNVEIMYKHEAKLGDTLNLFYAKQDNANFVTIKNKDDDKLHCIVKLY